MTVSQQEQDEQTQFASAEDGMETGRKFRAMEELGWDPGNTYLAIMLQYKDDPDWVAGFKRGLLVGERS